MKDGEWRLITHRAARAANRECALACLKPLAQTKIRKFDVKILIKQNVFAFQIAIDYSRVV